MQAQTNEICAVISWDDADVVTWEVDYNIVQTQFASAFQSMDPDSGVLSPNAPFGTVGFLMFANFGDVFSPTYADGSFGAFWDGFDGITSSDPNLGIAPDYDGGGLDDLYLVGTAPLTAGPGSFTLTIPMDSDPSAFYNEGTFTTSNGGTGKITVVPEPSSGLLLAGVCLFLTGRHRRS